MSKSSLMIDLETLSTETNAAILSIGAVKFDHTGKLPIDRDKDTFYARINIDDDEFKSLGFHISDSTIEWWGRQSQTAIEEAFSSNDRTNIRDVFLNLNIFSRGVKYVWANGKSFDIVICETVYKKLQEFPPWRYYNIRDCRTIYDLGISPELPAVTAHNALEDAIAQAIGVQNVYRKLQNLMSESTSEHTYIDDFWEERTRTVFDHEKFANKVIDECLLVLDQQLNEDEAAHLKAAIIRHLDNE